MSPHVTTLHAQTGQPAGRSIGKISTNGDLIVFELDEDALGKTNLFDLGPKGVDGCCGDGVTSASDTDG